MGEMQETCCDVPVSTEKDGGQTNNEGSKEGSMDLSKSCDLDHLGDRKFNGRNSLETEKDSWEFTVYKANSSKSIHKDVSDPQIEKEVEELSLHSQTTTSQFVTSTEELDTVRTGESLVKFYTFETPRSDIETEKCVAFWRTVSQFKDLDPVRCIMEFPEKEKKVSNDVTKDVLKSDSRIWYNALVVLQKRKMDQVALAGTGVTCTLCEKTDPYFDFKKKQYHPYSPRDLKDSEDITCLNDWPHQRPKHVNKGINVQHAASLGLVKEYPSIKAGKTIKEVSKAELPKAQPSKAGTLIPILKQSVIIKETPKYTPPPPHKELRITTIKPYVDKSYSAFSDSVSYQIDFEVCPLCACNKEICDCPKAFGDDVCVICKCRKEICHCHDEEHFVAKTDAYSIASGVYEPDFEVCSLCECNKEICECPKEFPDDVCPICKCRKEFCTCHDEEDASKTDAYSIASAAYGTHKSMFPQTFQTPIGCTVEPHMSKNDQQKIEKPESVKTLPPETSKVVLSKTSEVVSKTSEVVPSKTRCGECNKVDCQCRTHIDNEAKRFLDQLKQKLKIIRKDQSSMTDKVAAKATVTLNKRKYCFICGHDDCNCKGTDKPQKYFMHFGEEPSEKRESLPVCLTLPQSFSSKIVQAEKSSRTKTTWLKLSKLSSTEPESKPVPDVKQKSNTILPVNESVQVATRNRYGIPQAVRCASDGKTTFSQIEATPSMSSSSETSQQRKSVLDQISKPIEEKKADVARKSLLWYCYNMPPKQNSFSG